MKVTCSKCNTLYEILDGLVEEAGSKVKCAQCGNVEKVYPGGKSEFGMTQTQLETLALDIFDDGIELSKEDVESLDDLAVDREEIGELDLDIGLDELREIAEEEERGDLVMETADEIPIFKSADDIPLNGTVDEGDLENSDCSHQTKMKRIMHEAFLRDYGKDWDILKHRFIYVSSDPKVGTKLID